MANNSLCPNCIHSVWCPTWAEYKCLKKAIRFSICGHSQPTGCSDYKKRGKDFKEPKCQCEDCLKNEILWDEEEETND